MRQRKLTVALLVCLPILAGLWFVASPVKPPRAHNAEPTPSRASGALDGMTFSGTVSVDGKPLDIVDKWIFARGTFVSTECKNRCNYARAPYFVRSIGRATEFISESRCRDKHGKLVWRGVIDGATVRGSMTWTVSRWYWRIERNFSFEGKLTTPISTIAGN